MIRGFKFFIDLGNFPRYIILFGLFLMIIGIILTQVEEILANYPEIIAAFVISGVILIGSGMFLSRINLHALRQRQRKKSGRRSYDDH